ncbi:hypothetical protein NKG05_04940 [Oerskovia sp. M15]
MEELAIARLSVEVVEAEKAGLPGTFPPAGPGSEPVDQPADRSAPDAVVEA